MMRCARLPPPKSARMEKWFIINYRENFKRLTDFFITPANKCLFRLKPWIVLFIADAHRAAQDHEPAKIVDGRERLSEKK